MAKQVIFDAEVRSALKRGVDIVAGAVKVTIGPRGRNVALDKSWGSPDHHQRRRLDREGNHARGQIREHGRFDREGSRDEDQRQSG